MFATMMKNWWTSLLGFAAGFVYYLQQNGATVPTTKAEWINVLVAALIAGLGFASKDAITGSKPQ